MNATPLSTPDPFARELQRLVMRYSLSWLAAGCMTGFLMALMLFHPAAGGPLGEWSYGRWVAVHLNFQLFGWSAMPLVGVLLKSYLRPGEAALRQANAVLGAWSLALALGGVSWLVGETSGKLFLDWSGTPRWLFLVALALLWSVLAWNYPAVWRRDPRALALLKGALLLGLAAVPFALYHVTGRSEYPAIDPGTGGPTGASLLGSTLGILLVFALLPRLLGVPRSTGSSGRAFWVWYGVAALYFALMDHGNSSHRDVRQIAAVALLLVGAPTLVSYLRQFRWNPGAWLWLAAVLGWWSALVAMGFIVFLPGILEQAKFTHALVAHADLAMPGLITSLNMLVLAHLGPPGEGNARAITGRAPFWLWQGALVVQVVLLIGIAIREAVHHGELWKADGGASLFFSLRLMTGISMGAAALWWAWSAWRGRNYER